MTHELIAHMVTIRRTENGYYNIKAWRDEILIASRDDIGWVGFLNLYCGETDDEILCIYPKPGDCLRVAFSDTADPAKCWINGKGED